MNYNFLIKKARPLIPNVKCRARHISFIVYRKKILSIGIANSFRTNPLALKYNYRFAGSHAELDAIRRFPLPPSELQHCTLVNIRFLADGTPAMAKPCVKCRKLLSDFNITDVYYTTNFNTILQL